MGESSLSGQKQSVTLWHDIFESLIRERAPGGFEIRGEVQLKPHAARIDLLILRRLITEMEAPATNDTGNVLRKLWPLLPEVTIVEFKSPERGLRRGELLRLDEYRARYLAGNWRELPGPEALAQVMIVPRVSKALRDELTYMGWELLPLGAGYAAVAGACYTTYVVFTEQVCEAEHDDFLRIFSKAALQTREAQYWLEYWMTEKYTMGDITQREGYEELRRKFIDSIPVEERLKGIEPEQRVAGLSEEQLLLTLPNDALRALSDDYIATLSPETQREIRTRLGRSETDE